MKRGRYAPTPNSIQFVGEPEYLNHINALLDEAETRLTSCPFCGGRAVMDAIIYISAPATRALCSRCSCGTICKTSGYNFFTGKNTTLEQTIETAVDTWNRRAARDE